MRLLRRFANDPRASTALLELASRLPPRCAPPLARRVLRTLTEVLHVKRRAHTTLDNL
jgi:hypothetical protein